jgi:predicted DNA-binding protein (UPF0251 family)
LSYCPRSSLPAEVLTWLAGRLAHLLPPRPPGVGGNPPLALEVRLDAVAAVLLDGLSYRRAGRMVGISKTEVGASLKWATAKVERTSQRGNGDRSQGRERAAERGGDFDEAPPF